MQYFLPYPWARNVTAISDFRPPNVNEDSQKVTQCLWSSRCHLSSLPLPLPHTQWLLRSCGWGVMQEAAICHTFHSLWWIRNYGCKQLRNRIWPQIVFLGFPGGSNGKESTCNPGDLGSIPRLGRSLAGGHGNPLQYSCWRFPRTEETGGERRQSYSPWGCKESDTTEWLSTAQLRYTWKEWIQWAQRVASSHI